MKMVIAIIDSDDSAAVLSEITRQGLSATKLSTSGGFLRAGNVTLLIGVPKERLSELLEILRRFSSKRTQMMPPGGHSFSGEVFPALPVEVTVGGATVFVLDVEQFYKL